MVWNSIGIIIFIIVCWIYTDLKFGKKKHEENVPPFKEQPYRRGDAVFFSNGDEYFNHLLHYINKAKDHIHMQFYIFRDDLIGTEILKKLLEKAKEGVTVRLLIDFVGAKISKKMKKKLIDGGVLFKTANKPKFPFLFFRLNMRNHRKLTIIDGKFSYVGSFNVGDEYLGRDPNIGNWRDYHLFLTGEVVEDLQTQFIRDWNDADGEKITIPSIRYFPPLIPGELKIQIHSTNGAHVKEKLLSLMNKAESSILIGTPYFVPGKKMLNHLLHFANKGMKITVLIPKFPDHLFVKDAAYPYLRKLFEAGIEIRQYHHGFYHSKIVVIDDKIIDIGTANFDLRSFHLNYEVNCIIEDKQWTSHVKKFVQLDFYENGEQMTEKDLYERSAFERTKEVLASILSPLL